MPLRYLKASQHCIYSETALYI